ncbi:MAG: hypothetical protein IT546_04935 [Caulobacteraceae bacterium]|nr:hypothetical protein [Caulobacteraceae bacterium]
MMTAALLAAALTAAPATGLPLKPGEVECGLAGVRKAGADSGQLQKLTELPAARMELAVDRRVGQCRIPVIVVRDVEAPRPAPPIRRGGAPSHRR